MENFENVRSEPLLGSGNQTGIHDTAAVFTTKSDDIPPINGIRDFLREFSIEIKKLWYLAGPAIFTSLSQYSLGAITLLLAGHISTIALAAVSVENSVIAGFCFGVMIKGYRLNGMLISGEDGGCRGYACQSSASLPASCVDGVADSWSKVMRCQCLVQSIENKRRIWKKRTRSTKYLSY
ncbi:hypothetical protein AHAS_Ahas05G0094500 [Arachis hypogaea]